MTGVHWILAGMGTLVDIGIAVVVIKAALARARRRAKR